MASPGRSVSLGQAFVRRPGCRPVVELSVPLTRAASPWSFTRPGTSYGARGTSEPMVDKHAARSAQGCPAPVLAHPWPDSPPTQGLWLGTRPDLRVAGPPAALMPGDIVIHRAATGTPSAAIYVFHDRPGLVQARVRCPAGRSLCGCPPGLMGCGSFMACVLAGCRGEAWLKKGLLSS
jgi:hypothetical protein